MKYDVSGLISFPKVTKLKKATTKQNQTNNKKETKWTNKKPN